MLEGGPPAHRLSPARTAPAAGARAGATVLVVDDDDAIRDFLRSALECEGYGVLAAGDGLDALALCERYAPDVILLDLMMPRLSGLAFLARYRERFGAGPEAGVPGTPDVPIYVMSAVRAAVDEAAAAGVAGTFVKPFDLDELLETVGAAVERRRLERLSALAVPLTPAAQRTRHAPPRSVGRPR
ncbi:MAG TPA: response regulator [Chloroflexota bacterium]|nr:response regulator [Chloroflexota bacterium]